MLSPTAFRRKQFFKTRRLGYIQERRMNEQPIIEEEEEEEELRLQENNKKYIYKNKPIVKNVCDKEVSRLIRKNGILNVIITSQKEEIEKINKVNKNLEKENEELKKTIESILKENQELRKQTLKKKKRKLFKFF